MSKRPIRVANCSGAMCDPGEHMFNQAKYGPVDVITGDYLAEMNLANSAEAYRRGENPGWISTAWDGIERSIDLLTEKRIKLIINGGCLNPRGLAEKAHRLAVARNLQLKVAYVEGDDLFPQVSDLLNKHKSSSPRAAPLQQLLPHLDSANPGVRLAPDAEALMHDPEALPVVSANAYLGCRAIKHALARHGADVVICGRVSDASPVMAAAAWWHGWPDEGAYDELAGALVAGHLVECSTYVTGGNFAGFTRYPVDQLLDLGLPIVEIDHLGSCVVTKHEALRGVVTEDTVRCQLLYELQGTEYLNSDVRADLSRVRVSQAEEEEEEEEEEEGAGEGTRSRPNNRVRVSGVRGGPPPPTTKLAVFYRGGWQTEILINGTGYAMERKWELQEAQLRGKLGEWGVLGDLDVLDFQRVGVTAGNPRFQLESTAYLRIFAQAKRAETIEMVGRAWSFNAMAHFPGMHTSITMNIPKPQPFLAYYPALVDQTQLVESVCVLHNTSPSDTTTTTTTTRHTIPPPPKTEPLGPRADYDPADPRPLSSFGPTVDVPLGDVALARSGDKGANINIGLFPAPGPDQEERWQWLRAFLTRDRMKRLMGRDWREDRFHVERVEFADIRAVHFVIYGPLGRGVSSSRLLDALGKGFAEFVRAVHVPVPEKFLRLGSASGRL